MAEQKEQSRFEVLDAKFKFKDLSVGGMKMLAKSAEKAERYEDMVVFMKSLVEKRLTSGEYDKKGANGPLESEERNLFSVAYKNVIGSRRTSWRQLDNPADDKDKDDLKDIYKTCVAKEIQKCSEEVTAALDKLAKATEKLLKEGVLDAKNDSLIFYKKMLGDYYRYVREVFPENKDYTEKCQSNYEAAMKLAEDNLPATDPTRLGLALNYSVCLFEILGNQKKACETAKSAFDSAIEKLDSLNDDSYKDSTLIMQLLRDNLTIWNDSGDDANADATGPNTGADYN